MELPEIKGKKLRMPRGCGGDVGGGKCCPPCFPSMSWILPCCSLWAEITMPAKQTWLTGCRGPSSHGQDLSYQNMERSPIHSRAGRSAGEGRGGERREISVGLLFVFYMPLGIIVYLLYSQSHVPCRLCLTLFGPHLKDK